MKLLRQWITHFGKGQTLLARQDAPQQKKLPSVYTDWTIRPWVPQGAQHQGEQTDWQSITSVSSAVCRRLAWITLRPWWWAVHSSKTSGEPISDYIASYSRRQFSFRLSLFGSFLSEAYFKNRSQFSILLYGVPIVHSIVLDSWGWLTFCTGLIAWSTGFPSSSTEPTSSLTAATDAALSVLSYKKWFISFKIRTWVLCHELYTVQINWSL
jgi:hypothetical protein